MAEPSLSWDQFMAVELRAGTIIEAALFPEARKPAFQLLIDFGPRIGLKKPVPRSPIIISLKP